jgi:5-hydroxyisourate hydrolase
VLDNERGQPAVGVRVTLERLEGESFVMLADGVTDEDGRIADLLAPFELQAGVYQISFDAGGYFDRRKGDRPFLRLASVAFEIADARRHYHVPLLMTRYACTSYRGS